MQGGTVSGILIKGVNLSSLIILLVCFILMGGLLSYVCIAFLIPSKNVKVSFLGYGLTIAFILGIIFCIISIIVACVNNSLDKADIKPEYTVSNSIQLTEFYKDYELIKYGDGHWLLRLRKD